MMIDRRRFLMALGASAVAAHAGAKPLPPVRLAAAWDEDGQSHVGVLRIVGAHARVEHAVRVPTRAHALAAPREGSVLAVARRPGDWLARIDVTRTGRVPQTTWIEPSRSFNGHVVASPDGMRVYTTETDQEDGGGIIGVRDAITLRKLDEWRTHGRDPHEAVWLELPTGPALAVANGGIATTAETGRAKLDLAHMDSSLVLLDARDGALVGQWRLADPRLGLRHIAHRGATLALALQAEHDDETRRATAPVLALFDGNALRTAPAPKPLRGYGGGAIATGDGFAVSCPRAGGVAHYDAAGRWLRFSPLANACALAHVDAALWAGGGSHVLRERDAGRTTFATRTSITLDNHWIVLGSAIPPKERS